MNVLGVDDAPGGCGMPRNGHQNGNLLWAEQRLTRVQGKCRLLARTIGTSKYTEVMPWQRQRPEQSSARR